MSAADFLGSMLLKSNIMAGKERNLREAIEATRSVIATLPKVRAGKNEKDAIQQQLLATLSLQISNLQYMEYNRVKKTSGALGLSIACACFFGILTVLFWMSAGFYIIGVIICGVLCLFSIMGAISLYTTSVSIHKDYVDTKSLQPVLVIKT